MKNFSNLYKISKTLRFELKPVGKTLQNIKSMGVLERDEIKAVDRKKMQEYFDGNFKSLLDSKLTNLVLDIEDLTKSLIEGNSAERSKEELKIKKLATDSLHAAVVNNFKSSKNFDSYFKAKDHYKLLCEQLDHDDQFLEIASKYDGFTTYFANFFAIRKTIFTGTKKGSVAYRLINENLPKFKKNIDNIGKLPEELKEDLYEIGLDRINSIGLYNDFLTQENITVYNELLGGVALENGEKIQGINEKINLYSQKNKVKLPKLETLDKMILSDVETSSFVYKAVEDDIELVGMVEMYLNSIAFTENIPIQKKDNIFIRFDQLGNLPGISYQYITHLIEDRYDSLYLNKKRGKTYFEKRKKDIKGQKYSIATIEELLKDDNINLYKNLVDKYCEIQQKYLEARKLFFDTDWQSVKDIRQSSKKIVIKGVFDELMNLKSLLNVYEFVDQRYNPCNTFYTWLEENIKALGYGLNEVLNMSRNYLTKKQYSTQKFKLNFDAPTLASGWDVNKEIDNSSIILRKYNEVRNDYDYFVGIWEKYANKKAKKLIDDNNGKYEKMNYKLYPDASKMMPKQFMSKIWKEKVKFSDEFENKYKNGLHKKGDNFDKKFLHELIDHFKYGLENHEERYQEVFDFRFRDTKDYQSYVEFIRDVEKDNYKVDFFNVSGVEDLINDGVLYLFQIWTKDFSAYSKGTKSLNTIFFEGIFSEENLKKPRFKLSGGAEVFFRPGSLRYSDEIMRKGHHYNQLKDSFKYPIIKDKRYTEDKFILHVPMDINYYSDNISPMELNNRVNNNIEQFKHIIGIDRGERHLIYISVVEVATGKIVEQKHLDEIINTDTNNNMHCTSYLAKLEERGMVRDKERKSWDTIETIKELKEGYISQVVNEINNLQKKYNAIIVMENLNYGFKKSRMKVEKQVYQKFESALIKKFNYLIDKRDPNTYLNGIQLTNQIETLDKIGNQSGIIFYIPAWNTSKIDPVTGFVNMIYGYELSYKNKETAKKFIDKIDRIYFEENMYKFDIDFSKWNNRYQGSKMKWTLTTYGTRVETRRDPKSKNQWVSSELDLTEEFKKVINDDGGLVNDSIGCYKNFMRLFKLMLQTRNSITGTDIDYMISPVLGYDGKQFDSRLVGKELPDTLPKDADANGAYNIARKGIMAISNICNNIKNPFTITNVDYLNYVQNMK